MTLYYIRLLYIISYYITLYYIILDPPERVPSRHPRGAPVESNLLIGCI